jgi:hypothetical protein
MNNPVVIEGYEYNFSVARRTFNYNRLQYRKNESRRLKKVQLIADRWLSAIFVFQFSKDYHRII